MRSQCGKHTSLLCRVYLPIDLFLQVFETEGGTGYLNSGVLQAPAASWENAEAFSNVCHFHFIAIFPIDLFLLALGWHFLEPGPQCDIWNLFRVIRPVPRCSHPGMPQRVSLSRYMRSGFER